jgi:hypothetical protein
LYYGNIHFAVHEKFFNKILLFTRSLGLWQK